MSRFVWILSVALATTIAGCKPSDKPKANVNPKDGSTNQRQNQTPETPKVQRPEQPPVTGQRDVANADRDELIQCLGHEDMGIRLEASDRLVGQGSEAVPLLVRALDDDNYHVRAGAVFALGCLGTEAESASAKLEKLAAEDEWEAVRDAAKFALQSINGE